MEMLDLMDSDDPALKPGSLNVDRDERGGLPENQWGFAKRLAFVEETIASSFPNRSARTVRVLDVGCGNGTQLALPLCKRGYDITGVDPDPRSIERGKQLTAGAPNLHFECGTVEYLSAEPFDVLIISEVLEHMRDPAGLLSASLRHLQEKGIVIVTVPNGYGEFEIDSWIFRKLHLQALVDLAVDNGKHVVACTDNLECRHVQFFTRKRLKRMFAQCSLAVVKEASASFLSGPIIGHTLARSKRFIRWNVRVTDELPLALASAWYFLLRRVESDGR